MFIEHLIAQERKNEGIRKTMHEQEIQEEKEAKQRVKDELMQALVNHR
jgi:uncharacterized protein YdcH (DUF465 family)